MTPVVVPAGERIREAVELQLQYLELKERRRQARELLESVDSGLVKLDALTVQSPNRVEAAQLLVTQPDRTMFVWPAVSRRGLNPVRAAEYRRLLGIESRRLFDASRCWIGQTLLDTDQRRESRELREAGFPHLTDLLFLHREFDAAPPDENSPIELAVDVFDESSNANLFAKTLEQTWIGTLDCPELDGSRTGQEALVSHRLSGTFDPSRWWLFRLQGEVAGVLLMTAHPPDRRVWEVVYLGVVPEFRGRRLGRLILGYGLQQAQCAGAEEVVLAVDTRNRPALDVYKRFDFREFDRRLVHGRLKSQSES